MPQIEPVGADVVISMQNPNSSSSPSKVVEIARRTFKEGVTKPLKFRRAQLKNVLRFLEENGERIIEALDKDLRKPRLEAICYEIGPLQYEIKNLLMNLENYAKPERPEKPLSFLMDGAYIYNDPYGVVLVIGSWNYPLNLLLIPVVGAIAAGNSVVMKPSDLAPAIGQLLADLLPQYLDPDCYPVFLGGIEETTELLKERFDYIFYTGSTAVGRIVHKAANEFLTPTTLELGGKSPVYLDESVDLDTATKRILWGKFVNAGQTCIAPDYILCTKEMQEKFVNCARKIIKDFYNGDLKSTKDLGRIVNRRHFNRVHRLLQGLKIEIGGKSDVNDDFIEPTIAVDVSPNHPIMQEEIFGPILPIILIKDLNEAINFVNHREKPLVLYIFSTKKAVRDEMLTRTSSGGVAVNDTLLHIAVETLPFGGVGNSGMGAYHGKRTFDTFCHKKSVLVKNFAPIMEKLMASRYPPYSKRKITLLTEGTKKRRGISMGGHGSEFLSFLLGVIITISLYFIINALK